MIRLQFSLRALLLLVTLAGAALWVYRLPFQETKQLNKTETRTTTYRRGWNGGRIKHGRQFITGPNQQLVQETLFQNDVRILDREYLPSGQLDTETAYPPPGNVALVRRLKSIAEETIVIEQRIALDAARISTVWRTSQGQQLQSADYEAGLLTRWNDQPIEIAMQRALKEVADPVVRAGWLAECHPDAKEVIEKIGDNLFRETCWLGRQGAGDNVLVPGELRSTLVLRVAGGQQFEINDMYFFFSAADEYSRNAVGQMVSKPHFPSLLKNLLAANFTLVVRDGVVCAVPINSSHLQPR